VDLFLPIYVFICKTSTRTKYKFIR
jgi:hypothetical protein